jgi:hypothetical protein
MAEDLAKLRAILQQKDEEFKAMLELQCIVIEDLLLKSRFAPTNQSQGRPPIH